MWNSLKKFWLLDDPRSYGARAILQGAADGLRSVGKVVRQCLMETDAEGAKRMGEDLLRFEPDAILLANHPSSLFLRQIGFEKSPCLTLVWLLDDPYLMGAEPFSSEEIVLVADPSFAQAARSRGAERILFLPVAAPVMRAGKHRDECACKVSYVGSASNVDHMRSQLPDDLALYFDRIIIKKIEEPYLEFEELLQKYPLAPGKAVPLTGQLCYYLYANSNRLSRLHFLLPLAKHGLKLYGNQNWEPQIEGTALEPCFQGGIEPLVQFPDLIASTQININLRSLQGFVTPTQRDFLVPRCGGFMISTAHQRQMRDWRSVDPQNHFQLDRFPWSPIAATPEELEYKVQEYLQIAEYRSDWTLHAAQVIEEHHTFAHRMQQLGLILGEV